MSVVGIEPGLMYHRKRAMAVELFEKNYIGSFICEKQNWPIFYRKISQEMKSRARGVYIGSAVLLVMCGVVFCERSFEEISIVYNSEQNIEQKSQNQFFSIIHHNFLEIFAQIHMIYI